MNKYLGSAWLTPKVTAVEIDRETASSVWVNGNRRAKVSNDEVYFDTWEEAKAFVVGKKRTEVEAAEKRLEAAKVRLTKAKLLTKDEAGE